MDNGYEIKTTVTKDGKIIQQLDHIAYDIHEQISRRVIDTQEQQVRDALIALGWTPPC